MRSRKYWNPFYISTSPEVFKYALETLDIHEKLYERLKKESIERKNKEDGRKKSE